MRTIVLFLILINIAFYYWASQSHGQDIVFDQPRSVAGYKPIMLLTERDQAQDADSPQSAHNGQQPATGVENEPPYKEQCYSLGPFAQEQTGLDTYETLFDADIQARQRTVNKRNPKSYWVYLPSQRSKQAANKTVEFLQKNNVTEYYIWLERPHKYAVSLGLFKRLKTARRKIKEVEKLDLQPEMQVRFEESTEYWVDFNHNGNAPQPPVIEEMLVKNDRMLILETKCL